MSHKIGKSRFVLVGNVDALLMDDYLVALHISDVIERNDEGAVDPHEFVFWELVFKGFQTH